MPGDTPALTAVEITLLHCLANGMTLDEATRVIFLSVDTLNYHAANLRRKLGAVNQAHAVGNACRLGLIDLHRIQPGGTRACARKPHRLDFRVAAA